MLLSVLVLGGMGALGVATLRRFARFLTPLELSAYGVPLGVVAVSLALLPFANLFGLGPLLPVAAGLLAAGVALRVWPTGASFTWLHERQLGRADPTRFAGHVRRLRASGWRLIPGLVVLAFALRWAIFWSTALTVEADGLWASQVNIWGDWVQHLGDVTSFVYGGNLPPDHPRFAGHPYPYHYLTSFTSALMVELGMTPAAALAFHSFLFSILITLGVYVFARRLTRSSCAAALALTLFLLGGGFGWSLVLGEINRSHSILGTLWQHPWDQSAQDAANFRWQNMFFSLIAPQRGYLYGLPLSLLILTLLLAAVESRRASLFLTAGLTAGMLPLAHLSTLLALSLITPFLFLLFPGRRWALFFAAWLLLALPQLYFQQGGQPGATAAARIQLGWVAPPDPWGWFWFKNLGWFLPFLILALGSRTLLPPPIRRFVWSCMSLFVLANLLVFQPWDWDNAKVLLYWFLIVCIVVSALLVRAWQEQPTALVRLLIAACVGSMILSGLLVNLNQLEGKDRHLLLTTEELQLVEEVRTHTPARAIFVVGLQHNHPIPVLTGRRVVLSYTGVLWAQGLSYAEREQDIRSIYAFAPETPRLLSKYKVDYVVIGPWEQEQLHANVAAYQAHYPVVIRTNHYDVFAVKE